MLKLTAPAQSDLIDPRVETDPKRLKVWLSGLPLADRDRALEKLCDAVSALNRQQCSSDRRLALMRTFRQTSFDLIEPMEQDLADNPLASLRPKEQILPLRLGCALAGLQAIHQGFIGYGSLLCSLCLPLQGIQGRRTQCPYGPPELREMGFRQTDSGTHDQS